MKRDSKSFSFAFLLIITLLVLITIESSTATVFNNGLLSSTAQTLNVSGMAQTSFVYGETMKICFVLGSLGGNGSIVWAITLQHDGVVYNWVNVPCFINTVGTIITYSQLIPVYYPVGIWTANIQVYASDGVTPIGVTNLTFNVT